MVIVNFDEHAVQFDTLSSTVATGKLAWERIDDLCGLIRHNHMTHSKLCFQELSERLHGGIVAILSCIEMKFMRRLIHVCV